MIAPIARHHREIGDIHLTSAESDWSCLVHVMQRDFSKDAYKDDVHQPAYQTNEAATYEPRSSMCLGDSCSCCACISTGTSPTTDGMPSLLHTSIHIKTTLGLSCCPSLY